MWNNKQKENRYITQWKSMKRWRTLIQRKITKQRVKNEQIKRKQTCSLHFVNVFKFQENKFKIVQKNFLEIKIILMKRRFLGKATGHNDHYMIMDVQMLKIGGNWPLTCPYMQCWLIEGFYVYLCAKNKPHHLLFSWDITF